MLTPVIYTRPWHNVNTHLFWPNQHSARTAQSLAFTNLDTLDSVMLWSVTYAHLVRTWDRLLVRMQDCLLVRMQDHSIAGLGLLDLLGFKVAHSLGKGTTDLLGGKFAQSLGLRLFAHWGPSLVLVHNLHCVLFHNPQLLHWHTQAMSSDPRSLTVPWLTGTFGPASSPVWQSVSTGCLALAVII